MRKFLVSFNAVDKNGATVVGDYDCEVPDRMTSKFLRNAMEEFRQRRGFSSIVILAFSEYEEEE